VSAWIQTFSGLQFFPEAPRAQDVRIKDIAVSLSRTCRFRGHTLFFYSVAEHSILVSRLVHSDLRLAALLHDGAEAYMADLPAPIKRLPEMAPFRRMESRILHAIYSRYDVMYSHAEATIREADLAMLATERDTVMAKAPVDWGLTVPAAEAEIRGWTPEQATDEFLGLFGRLMAARNRPDLPVD